MKLINIGFSNYVSDVRIIAVAVPEAEPIKRLVRDAKDDGRVIDATQGKRTKSVIVTDSDHVILSALTPDLITRRIAGDESSEADE